MTPPTENNSDGQNTDPQSMDHPNGPTKWTTPKWITPEKYHPRWVARQAAATIHLHCTEDTPPFTPHRLQPPFWITILNKTTTEQKTRRFKPTEVSAEHASMDSSGKTFNNKICFHLITWVTTGLWWVLWSDIRGKSKVQQLRFRVPALCFPAFPL